MLYFRFIGRRTAYWVLKIGLPHLREPFFILPITYSGYAASHRCCAPSYSLEEASYPPLRRPLNKKSPLSDFFLHIQQIFTNFAVQIKLYYYD